MTQDTNDVVGLIEGLREFGSYMPDEAARGRIGTYVSLCSAAASTVQSQSARIAELEGVLRRVEPYVDAIVCYASSMDEHEPNRIAFDVRNALTKDSTSG